MDTARETEIPRTEGIKYAGSKLRLLPHILRLARRTGAETVFDGFSGTTRVTQAFARIGKTVISNDSAGFSKVFGLCYLKNRNPRSYYSGLFSHLNGLEGEDGWFTEHYGGSPDSVCSTGEDGLKKPFQIHNTRKLDAIREEIERIGLDEIEKSVLLTGLILALDRVDNTLGHFAAYLRKWSARSYKELELRVPDLIPREGGHLVFQEDIFDIAGRISADLAYLDPPYGSNNELMPPSRVRYGAYYHLWKTVVLNDRPELFGKAKRRVDSSDQNASVFEDFRRNPDGEFVALAALEKLIREVRAKHVILSYGSGGRATAEAVSDALERNGEVVEIVTIDQRRNVMSSMRWTNEWVRNAEEPNREFLFLLRK